MSDELSRAEVQEILETMHDPETDIEHFSALFSQIVAHDAAQRALLRQREERIATLEKALLTSCSDHMEHLTCEPTCNSYGHAENCAVANPRLEYDRLRAQLATVTQERDLFQGIFGEHDSPPCTIEQARTIWNHLTQQLATVTAHLEAQRTATYQAVEREHEAKWHLATARQALQALYDVQNGAPLPKYEQEWQAAMKRAETLIDADKVQP